MFIVKERFMERYDNDHIYEVGDVYPREGFKATKKRIGELTTGENKYKRPFLVEAVEEVPEDKVAEEVAGEIEAQK